MTFLRTVLAMGLLTGALLAAGSAQAHTPSELAAGRQLFVEALADEEHGRLAVALEKYRRVQQIRDTAPVRYRIGSTLEGLGKITQAVEAYRAAVRIGNESGKEAEVVRAAQARLDALGPKIAHLVLRPPTRTWPDAEIMVDSEPVAAAALADVPVDPGAHVVTANATGARPFRAQITLPEGGRAEIPIVLETSATEPPPGPAPTSPKPASSLKTIGIVTGVAGGVLVIGGAIVLALRGSAISDLEQACPDGNCPASRERELTDTRDRAVVQGPIGITLLATGAAALGTGIVLFAVSGQDPKTAARLGPAPIANGAMFTFARNF